MRVSFLLGSTILATALVVISCSQKPVQVVQKGDQFYGFEQHRIMPAVPKGEVQSREMPPPNVAAKAEKPASVAKNVAPKNAAPIQDNAVVQPGDTVLSFATRNQVPVSGVIAVNNLTPPFMLKPGAKMKLPVKHTDVATPQTTQVASAKTDVTPAPVLKNLPKTTSAPTPVAKAVVNKERAEQIPLPQPGKPAVVKQVPQPIEIKVPEKPVAAESGLDARDKLEGKPRYKLSDSLENTAARPKSVSKVAVKTAESYFIWPVRGKVISVFGPKPGGLHNDGVNIAAPEGTPILAGLSGEVVYVGNELKGYGNLVIIKHDNGWLSAYAHQKNALVQKGQRVTQGQVIGYVGKTGNVEEPQLHFGIRDGKEAINPLEYVN